jgi:vitamin B12/bleomycin/antimicrobial peptide transport system ATP-binding/permease protein
MPFLTPVTFAMATLSMASLFMVMAFNGGAKIMFGLALVGYALAWAMYQSPRISSFLRLFITVFSIEYTLLGFAYGLSTVIDLPEALKAVSIPSELPLTVGLFGVLVYAVSFIPVVRQITGLADPYFDASNTKSSTIPLLGAVRERSLAWGLTIFLVVLNQLQVGISVRLSFFSRDWFNAIQNKDQAAFWSLLVTVFLFWAAIAVISNLIEYFVENILKLRWREYLVERYSARWLNGGSHYRMGFTGGADNPDQRIAEDVRNFIGHQYDQGSTYRFSISLLSTVSNLVSFSIILWSIPAQFAIPGTSIIVPGLPFWVALIYSFVGTWLTHLIGRPLIKLDFKQEKYEADFRYQLARLREYGEQVALLRGEPAERQHIGQRFTAIVGNTYDLIRQNLKLSTFTAVYFQASVVFPYVIMAPAFFTGAITLGQLQQTAGAFGRVEGAMQWFIIRYSSLANYKATVDRLSTFQIAMGQAEDLQANSGIQRHEQVGADVSMPALKLAVPDGETIVSITDLTLKAGERTLVTGPSGSGKSTLFRAVSGIWPYGEGHIFTPQGKRVLLLPQRPYLPMGTLKQAVEYPDVSETHSDETIRDALLAVKLPKLIHRLDEEAFWSQVLSLGEQQRVAIARALLSKPDWLFLDEATAALDEATEAAIYALLKERLPGTTVVSIGHRSTLVAMHDRQIELVSGADGLFTLAEATNAKRFAPK